MSFLTIDAETRKKVAAYLRQEAQLQRRATSLPINPAMSREQAADMRKDQWQISSACERVADHLEGKVVRKYPKT